VKFVIPVLVVAYSMSSGDGEDACSVEVSMIDPPRFMRGSAILHSPR